MDLTKFKPLLAETVTYLEKLTFPLIASPKLDGIRCVVINGKALSRNLKPIPNKFIRECIESSGLDNVDGEIMIPGTDFNGVQSAVMSFDGEPNFQYRIFDYLSNEPYKVRFMQMSLPINGPSFSNILYAKKVKSLKELMELEDDFVKNGYEGIMLRDPNGKYKFGRSTEKEQILLKLKRFHDAECTVIGFEEKMTNTNESKKDALGHSKRSSEKAGMVPAGTLGALIVIDCDTMNEFKIGSGFTDFQRQEIWDEKANCLNKTVTYKYQEISKYGIPRFPVFKVFREKE